MRLLESKPYHGRAMMVTSPVGPLRLVENGSALTHLCFGHEKAPEGTEFGETALLSAAAGQLAEYFNGRRRSFDLPLAPFGTEFQRRVWAELRLIPYGETRFYAQVAEALGQPGASRAVGQANNRNPLAIIIPCHRVLGRDGQLTGYAGGVEIKEYLLKLEEDVCCGRVRSCDWTEDDL